MTCSVFNQGVNDSLRLGVALVSRILCATIACYALLPAATFAQTPESDSGVEALFLDEVIRAPFTPQQVFFLVAFIPRVDTGAEQSQTVNAESSARSSGKDRRPFEIPQYSRYQAQLLPPFELEASKTVPAAKVSAVGNMGRAPHAEKSESGKAVEGMLAWRAGVRVAVPRGSERVVYAVIIAAEGNRFAVIPPHERPLSDGQLFFGRPELLREEVVREKASVRELQQQVDANEAELRRLRADADIIADLARIVEVRDELARTKQLIADLKVDQNNLAAFVKGAKALPVPRNFASRERQLTSQIAELAALSKETEGDEGLRRAESEQELQHKLTVIDRARGLDVSALQQELTQLQRSGRRVPRPGAPPHNLETPEDYLR